MVAAEQKVLSDGVHGVMVTYTGIRKSRSGVDVAVTVFRSHAGGEVTKYNTLSEGRGKEMFTEFLIDCGIPARALKWHACCEQFLMMRGRLLVIRVSSQENEVFKYVNVERKSNR